MKIVVLDGHTLNPGDLSWERLEALGETTVHPRTPEEQIVARAQGAQVVLVNKVPLSRETLEQLPDLRFIGVLATGYNIVDVEAAAERGIPVCNVPTYGTQSVAQMAFAHILNLTQHVAHHADTVKAGRWAESDDWCYWDFPLIELMDLTLGVVGYGRIGRQSGVIGKAYGMRVIAHDAYVEDSGDPDIAMVELETLLRESDIVTLHCPLTPETEKLMNAEHLALMKPTAFLVNTSRGPLVDEPALAQALNEGRIAGAGLDVLSVEPALLDNPLLTAKNCYITPHIAWATASARRRLMGTAVDNVRAFTEGRLQNVVNDVTL
ncbi:MAG: D-2-hydroxyacid dehydrogenase [Anaerolineae bacterium]|jgi:glycerate dehydrogenase